MPAGCFALFFLMIFLSLLPFFFANVALVALVRLGVSPEMSLLVLFGVMLGSAVNLPVRKVEHDEAVTGDERLMFGFGRFFPPVRRRSYTVIAVNLGGCIIPVALVMYQVLRIMQRGMLPVVLTVLAVTLNVAVCYNVARPVRGKGIVMRPLIPGVLAALSALLFLPDFAPPVAFTAGVLGPLIGADLLHLKDIARSPTGVASIGGAGTFDGIVISGLLALLLA